MTIHKILGALVIAALAGGCTSTNPPATTAPALPSSPDALASGWQHRTFPGKTPTRFSFAHLAGREVIAVVAESSASMLHRAVHVGPAALGALRFSWRVPTLIEQADMARRDADDSPVRIVLAFEGDRSRFSARDALLSELALTLTGEPLPYATLMYVWCKHRQAGEVITSPRTDRIRKLVVESGAQRLDQWLTYERDVRADFERVFGEPPGALVGIALMTDTDNTRSVARAWYGPVDLTTHAAAP